MFIPTAITTTPRAPPFLEMVSVTRVEILEETVYVSFCAITHGKGMNPSFFFSFDVCKY